jgi:hypothetical protein
LLAGCDDFFNGAEIDFGLAAAGDAEEEVDGEGVVGEPEQEVVEDFLLVVVQIRDRRVG